MSLFPLLFQVGTGTRATVREPRLLRQLTSEPRGNGNVNTVPALRARKIVAGGDSSAAVL